MHQNKITSTRLIVDNAIVAAIYCVITILSSPIAYGAIQFRIAECLLFLCFFRRDFIVGLTLGCLLSNIPSSLGFYDMIFGTIATFLTCLAIIFLSPRMIFLIIYPALFNGLIVGGELTFLFGDFFYVNAGYVALGEIVVMSGGYLLFLFLKRNKTFMNAIRADRHLNVRF